MANNCINYVVFSGAEHNLKTLADFLTDIVDNFEGVYQNVNESFYNGYINIIDTWDEVFTFESGWVTPINLLIAVAREHKVSFEVEYEELGSDDYGMYKYNYELHELKLWAVPKEVIKSIDDENDEGMIEYNGEVYESKNFILNEILDKLTKTNNYELISI